MAYELFISYSRKDNVCKRDEAKGWVTALHDEILADHRRFSTEPLRIFLDTSEIKDMDDWRHRILKGLRESRILLVCLSPDYFKSPPCLWEWEEYLKRQVHMLVGQESLAPVYFVEAPDSDEQLHAAWAETLAHKFVTPADRAMWEPRWKAWREATLGRLNWVDLKPWFPHGIEALHEAAVRVKISALGNSLWERIQRARRATSVPGNLRRLNPHFVGRRTELRQLHENLALGAVGIVTAVHGLGGQGKTELATAYAHGWADSYPSGLWVLGAEGKKEMLPLLGELCAELQIPLTVTPDETTNARGRRVLAELQRRAMTAATCNTDKGAACLIILDNVSEPTLLAEPQLAHIPREDWLRIVVTTREGPEKFPTSRQKSLAFIAVDALTENDAARLIEDHQIETNGQWPTTTAASDAAAAREIARELGGFTLAVESVAIYLGLHPDIRPTDYLTRLRTEGLSSVDELVRETDPLYGEAKVATQMQHREKQLRLVLYQTLARLTPHEHTALEYAVRLPPDSIPWPWLRALVTQEHPDEFAVRPGYPDPWPAVRRRLEGLRLLTLGDHPDLARMHRLVGATILGMLSEQVSTRSVEILVEFICDPQTPFAYGLPIEAFLSAWKLLDQTQSLVGKLIKKAANIIEPTAQLAEKWTELSYHLGDPALEAWWLKRWEKAAELCPALAQKRAAMLHRQGDTKGACSVLREYLVSDTENFDVSSRLLMYLAQIGHHAEAEAIAVNLSSAHAELLASDLLKRASFLHHRYFLFHELDQNDDAVAAGHFIRDAYSKSHLNYDALIAAVNLGDALWATGKSDEAIEILNSAHLKGQELGFAQVENIAAICLANVLSSVGSNQAATVFYVQGIALSTAIDHRWDLIYGQAYQALHDIEMGRAFGDILPAIRIAALEAGFEYLAALVDSHVCIGSFTSLIDPDLLQESMSRGLKSPFPASRLYALSAMLRTQLVDGCLPDTSKVREWIQTLETVQGIKGRLGVIARTADWLVQAGVLAEDDQLRVAKWTDRYISTSLVDFYRGRYTISMMTQSTQATLPADKTSQPSVKLRVCNLNECEARCCYDGVYLEDGEESKIRDIVASAPELFVDLPQDFIVDGSWGDQVSGRKTATKPYDFKSPDFPVHFNRTRCVFCSADHKCSSNVILKVRVLHFGSLVGDENLADGVGELDGDGLVFAEFAGVVVELGEGEAVAGDGFKIGVTVLDVDDERDGNGGAVVGAKAGLEA
jgi:tetratricopeptide (TPR) repeat protein